MWTFAFLVGTYICWEYIPWRISYIGCRWQKTNPVGVNRPKSLVRMALVPDLYSDKWNVESVPGNSEQAEFVFPWVLHTKNNWRREAKVTRYLATRFLPHSLFYVRNHHQHPSASLWFNIPFEINWLWSTQIESRLFLSNVVKKINNFFKWFLGVFPVEYFFLVVVWLLIILFGQLISSFTGRCFGYKWEPVRNAEGFPVWFDVEEFTEPGVLCDGVVQNVDIQWGKLCFELISMYKGWEDRKKIRKGLPF